MADLLPRGAAAALITLGLVACRGNHPQAPPPPPPADLLPGSSVHTDRLDLETLAEDALDPAALAELLEGARFESASQRSFSVRAGPVRQVVARVVRFDSPEGAADYLGWLRSHASDVLGEGARREEPLELSTSSAVFFHEPGGCCPNKALFWWLAAWARGDHVLTLQVGGAVPDRKPVDELANGLDAAV